MRSKVIFLHGFLIWIILFFIGWLLRVVFLSTKNIVLFILALVLIWIFSLPMVTESSFKVGIIWLLTSVILDLIFVSLILGYGSYYYQWNIWAFYFLLLIQPLIVKRCFKQFI